jgi:hypothetical protein
LHAFFFYTAATHGAGNIAFGLGVGSGSSTYSNSVMDGDQLSTVVGTSWAFICSCCSTAIFLFAVFFDATVMILTSVEGLQSQQQQPAPSAAASPPSAAEPSSPLSPVIRVLRFSLSFPGSNSPTTNVCTLSDLIEEEAQHQQREIQDDSL